MMERMVVPPVTVRGQRHDADDPADPIVGKTVAEKRAMAAIVLDHEETDEQARRRYRSHEADPAVKVKGHPHQGPIAAKETAVIASSKLPRTLSGSRKRPSN
jgi:hypothetical protein